MDVKQAIKRLMGYIRQHELLNPGDRVILGVSGGADSTAMLLLFSQIRYLLNLQLLTVHINHQLRGADSDHDQEAVKKLCYELNIPLIIRKVSLPKDGNLENEARKKRMEIFQQMMQLYQYRKVLLAHHQHDQAETVLLNLMRGSGVTGMAGIKPVSGHILHPMLCFSRKEIEELLQTAKLTWQTDSSNLDKGFSRNRVRHELIPTMRDAYNPQIVEHLVMQAEIFRQTEEIMLDRTRLQFKRIVIDINEEQAMLSLPLLRKLKPIERYYIYRKAIHKLSGVDSDFMSAHHLAIESVLAAGGSKKLDLANGILITKLYEELLISWKRTEETPEEKEVEIDAERARVVFGHYRFQFKYLRTHPRIQEEGMNKYRVLIDADAITYPFKIRYRMPGDRFIPFGMEQFKRLKEFFIDEKVPKYERDLVPLLDDGEKIFWVVGHRLDNRVRYHEGSSRYLEITVEPTQENPKRAANRKKNARGSDESDEL